ncbi:MAG: copper amine oxidase N-terminal domain-containing protein [Oscillospiraceae bacterium]|nr:copper amine oxidase N-terminal domain-containing protein [Oscillospiraceae bacterium]
MKKIISRILIAALLIVPSAAYADGISVFINGNKLSSDTEPFIENDRTLVPMRAIFEALGANVIWDGETHTVFAVRGNDLISIQTEQKNAFVNSEERELDVPAKIVNDRTFVPLRFISEALGCTVDWDGSSQTVTITETAPEN